MAPLPSRPVLHLALQLRLSRKSITSVQSAALVNAVLRRYTSTGLSGFRDRSRASQIRLSNLSNNFKKPVTKIQYRGYTELKASGGKTEADLIVEELQELCFSLSQIPIKW